MRYIWQHIRTIIDTYRGEIPLAHFLKNYFKGFPKLGSRDRRMLSAMVYSWYRCSKGLSDEMPFEERIGKCLSLCQGSEAVMSKLGIGFDVNIDFHLSHLFPYNIELSAGITSDDWLRSMLEQPALFIRIRRNGDQITSLLQKHDVPFTFISNSCLSLPNGAAIDSLLPPDCYVVQDASSQQTGTFFHPQQNEQWWDCCSGAGGKSLLLKDIEPAVVLTASDKRESILHNLKQRMKLYHHQAPHAMVMDVADNYQLSQHLSNKQFDNIICDVPCSGSGTWARTPEQMFFFDPGSADRFAVLQKTIAVNASHYLKTGGKLFYITCSVFTKENEEVVASVSEKAGLAVQKMQIINGVEQHADSMFIAVLERK